MNSDEARVSNQAELSKALAPLIEKGHDIRLRPIAGDGKTPMIFKAEYNETDENRKHRYGLMKECLKHAIPLEQLRNGRLGKTGGISIASNIYGYDLRAPSLHLIPWLSPIRDMTPRVQHQVTGDAAHWKSVFASSLSTGGFNASPWINEGARAPRVTFSAETKTAPFVTIGLDGSATYEAESGGRGFEDPLATARFIDLEKLMVMEEDALLGGNRTTLLGVAHTPAGTGGTDMYVSCVALTYEGYRNQTVAAGLIQQKDISLPDGKTETVNGGTGRKSSISGHLAFGAVTVTPKVGEFAYAWYAGTVAAAGSLYLQSITTVPKVTIASLTTTYQLLSELTDTDYSINNGTQGGANDQVTAFDGYLYQILAASQESTPNAYYNNLNAATLTASGRGSIDEIDAAFVYAWNNFRTTFDVMFVNAQELINITAGCLSNASGPLVRYEVSADGDHYDLTAAGTISFYYNPFVNGGSKIPIMVHPTLPPGTILLMGSRLPAYFKNSNMTAASEVICRRDYYSVDWAPRTREYEFGTYSEEVLGMYAPFNYGVITGIANGVGGLS